ncbi:2TM domain-containing protein [Ralstonia sp.]|uniref:2TM domain-containing protein n=1 Tax=Ralstonia sp. TaxID=54061 RepID=UPI0031DABFE1
MSAVPYTQASPSTESDAALLRRARHRAGVRLGFQIHLLSFLAINAGLAVIALSRGQFWFVWPLLGWGLGLAAHGLSLAWSQGNGYQRMVEQELARLREQAGRQ